jgi:hypothetical protein
MSSTKAVPAQTNSPVGIRAVVWVKTYLSIEYKDNQHKDKQINPN